MEHSFKLMGLLLVVSVVGGLTLFALYFTLGWFITRRLLLRKVHWEDRHAAFIDKVPEGVDHLDFIRQSVTFAVGERGGVFVWAYYVHKGIRWVCVWWFSNTHYNEMWLKPSLAKIMVKTRRPDISLLSIKDTGVYKPL